MHAAEAQNNRFGLLPCHCIGLASFAALQWMVPLWTDLCSHKQAEVVVGEGMSSQHMEGGLTAIMR